MGDDDVTTNWNRVLRLQWSNDMYEALAFYSRARAGGKEADVKGGVDRFPPFAIDTIDDDAKTKSLKKKFRYAVRDRYRLGFRADDHPNHPVYFSDPNPPPWTFGYDIAEEGDLVQVTKKTIVPWPEERLPVRYRLLQGDRAKDEFLDRYVSEIHGGHFAGAHTLITKIFRQFYIGITRRYAERFLKKNDLYRLVNTVPEKRPIKAYRPEKPLEIWQMDTTAIGGEDADILRMNRPYQKLLVVTDIFSKYTMLRPLTNIDAGEVAAFLEKIFLSGNVPEKIVHDRGVEFKKDVDDLCRRWNVVRAVSAPYSPQTQGNVEHLNFIIKRHIYARMQSRNTKYYVDILPLVEFAINDTRSTVTNQTPFEIHFGRSFARLADRDADPGIEPFRGFTAPEAAENAWKRNDPPQAGKKVAGPRAPRARRPAAELPPLAVTLRRGQPDFDCGELERSFDVRYDLDRRPEDEPGRPGKVRVFWEDSYVTQEQFDAFQNKHCNDEFPFVVGRKRHGKIQIKWKPTIESKRSHLKFWERKRAERDEAADR